MDEKRKAELGRYREKFEETDIKEHEDRDGLTMRSMFVVCVFVLAHRLFGAALPPVFGGQAIWFYAVFVAAGLALLLQLVGYWLAQGILRRVIREIDAEKDPQPSFKGFWVLLLHAVNRLATLAASGAVVSALVYAALTIWGGTG